MSFKISVSLTLAIFATIFWVLEIFGVANNVGGLGGATLFILAEWILTGLAFTAVSASWLYWVFHKEHTGQLLLATLLTAIPVVGVLRNLNSLF